MSWTTWRAGILIVALVAMVAPAQSAPQVDVSRWKTYRSRAMGFEAKYPPAWNMFSGTGKSFESVMLFGTTPAGEPDESVEFMVQRRINPKGVPIDRWYADQVAQFNAEPLPVTRTVIGGRPAIRREYTNRFGKHYDFYTALNKTDIFQVSIRMTAPREEPGEIRETILSTVRFIE